MTAHRKRLSACAACVLVAFTLTASGDQWKITSDQSSAVTTNQPTEAVAPAGTVGPDVIVGDLHQALSYGSLGGISAFAVGTVSCNAGNEELLWIRGLENPHPVVLQNMYRLMENRFEHIGQSWLKHGFFAYQQDACGYGCIDAGAEGTLLGVGCSSPTTASQNGQQSNMGPKSDVNGFTGSFVRTTGPCVDCDKLDRRLQVHDVDLDPAYNPEAIYFVESQNVAPDDAAAGNGENNASYRRFLIGHDTGENDPANPCRGYVNIVKGEYCLKLDYRYETQQMEAGIRAWKDHDPLVTETEIRVPNEGLFILAAKAIHLDDGNWQYEYALQNLNSHRSCGSFSVPLSRGTFIGETGFHDVDYHSSDTGGVHYDGTDWPVTVTDSLISWSTEQHDVSPDANALRWGTLYNFRFTTNAPPGQSEVMLGLFRPGDPENVTGTSIGPAGVGDCQPNGILDSCDISCDALGCHGECGGSLDCFGNGIPDECEADCNDNGVADACDIRDGTSTDCQPNGIPDSCEDDCDGDAIPDDCDTPEDCDSDGVTNCEDFCPCSSPVGGCICPDIDICCWDSFGCFPDWPRADCFAALGTPGCGDSPCAAGCTLAEIDGDVDRDGDLDTVDGSTFLACFSGALDDPDYVKPSAECLARFDYDNSGAIDLTDFQKLQSEYTGPKP